MRANRANPLELIVQFWRFLADPEVTGLYQALAWLALVVGTLATANASLVSVIERRSEIGLRRSLGAKRAHIIRQITTEAAVTGTIAALVGAATAVYAVSFIAYLRGWTIVIDPRLAISAPIIGLTTGAVAGLYPALRAAATPPAVTLKG